MRFVTTRVAGAFVVEADPLADDRGSFARLFCADEFFEAGLAFTPVQTNISHNPTAGTLRGLHYQAAPHGEAKLVQCVRGRIFDVAVDLRPESPSFRAAAVIELEAGVDRAFFIPSGCAHGFLSLDDHSDVLYCMGSPYVAGSGRGVRWDDAAFGIAWPATPRLISPRDAAYPAFGDGT
jgi:dTDP-4-dehydrorhamnose 3,5-epimerase